MPVWWWSLVSWSRVWLQCWSTTDSHDPLSPLPDPGHHPPLLQSSSHTPSTNQFQCHYYQVSSGDQPETEQIYKHSSVVCKLRMAFLCISQPLGSSKVIVIEIIKLISSKFHNFWTAEIILESANFFRIQNYFPLFTVLSSSGQPQVKLLKIFLVLWSKIISVSNYSARGLCHVFVRKLESVNQFLGGDVVLQIQLPQQLLHLENCLEKYKILRLEKFSQHRLTKFQPTSSSRSCTRSSYLTLRILTLLFELEESCLVPERYSTVSRNIFMSF